MKCSLLTLSTFVDDELAPQRRAEVDAHLVGCPRCSTGAATLREERTRVAQLARVTVDPASSQLMLEQVGITLDLPVDRFSPAPPPPMHEPPPDRPWQGGTSSAALPWTPRRPDTFPQPLEPVPTLQPDLPLDGVRSTPASWARVAEQRSGLLPGAGEADADPLAEHGWNAGDEEWLDGTPGLEAWEANLPPPPDPSMPTAPRAAPAPGALDTVEPAAIAPSPDVPSAVPPPLIEDLDPPAPPPTAAAAGFPAAGPPVRLATASGPAALLSRIRDALGVRLALARGADALEELAEIVTGPRGRLGAQPSAFPLAADTAPAAPAVPLAAVRPTSAEVELNGISVAPAPSSTASSAGAPAPTRDASDPPTADTVTDHPAAGVIDDPTEWNAFAASSYPDAPPAGPTIAPRPARVLGRHGRAVVREQTPISKRLGRGLAALSSALRAASAATATRTRQLAGRLGQAGPDNRLLAGIAGIGLIFVVALLVGHAGSHATSPRAPATAAPSTQARQSAPARSTAAATAGAPPVAAAAQSFGAGGTGYQVDRLRYGQQSGYMRVVFDIASSGATALTPRVTVSFSSPTTLLVTFAGTVPAGSTTTPNPGHVIVSAALVSSGAGKTEYRFTLARAATTTAFYLTSPTRFVLDVH